MHPIVEPFRRYLRGVNKSNADTTNNAFKLVCRLNVGILLCFVAFLSAKQFFGDPIECWATDRTVPKDILNNYCWTMGVYVEQGFAGSLRESVAKNGWHDKKTVEQNLKNLKNNPPPPPEKNYLRYYQWMGVVFLLMAISYAIPYCLWKIYENGRLNVLCGDLNSPLPVWTSEKKAALVEYFRSRHNSNTHYWYALRYFMYQILLLIISIGNIYMIDLLFGGFWTKFTPAIEALVPFNYTTYTHCTSQMFPRVGKCMYYYYGPSGTGQHFDSLCLLPLNILNEKLFTFLYFWLILMAVAAGLSVTWYTVCICSCYCRTRLIARKTIDKSYGTTLCATDSGRRGDSLVLYLLGCNMNIYVFSDLISEIAASRKEKHFV